MSRVTVTEPLISHRERKKLATRQAIHDAAFDLAECRGLQATTVEAISERAGVAPRTFWSYFASKEEAVLDTDPTTPERLRQALMARPAGEDVVTSLRQVLKDLLADRSLGSDRARRRQQMIYAEPALMATVAASYDEFARALTEAVAERVGVDANQDLLPGVLVMAATGACRIAQLRWANDQRGKALPELVDEAFERLADGLSPPAPSPAAPSPPALPPPIMSCPSARGRDEPRPKKNEK